MKPLTILLSMILVACVALAADNFKLYPGARINEKLTKEANDFYDEMASFTITKTNNTKVTVYFTEDDFEKVVNFYRTLGKEFSTPGTRQKIKFESGKELKACEFILDGANDVKNTKLYVTIERPYMNWKFEEGPDLTHIQVTRRK
jgi:hypothetical protein